MAPTRWALVACLALIGCGRIDDVADRLSNRRAPRERYLDGLVAAGLDRHAMVRDWIAAAERALVDAPAVTSPHREEDPSYRGLTVGSQPDPRVDVVRGAGNASDGVTPLWFANKYGSASASVSLATGIEAKLIVAEAAGGQAAVGIINELRARLGLTGFSSTDPVAIRNQLIEERRRELFLTGHHLGDLRQFNLALTPAPGVPFKDGGGTYRDQKCFPLPDVERLNNPNLNQ